MKFMHNIQTKFLFFSLVGVGFLLILSGIFLSSYALPEPVKSISFTSTSLNYQEKEPGSFEVRKKAEWTSFDTAEITFNVDTISKVNSKHRDIVLILNLSDAMSGEEKMRTLKSASYNFVNSVLEDTENRVAVIGFGTDAEILSEFSNDASRVTNSIFSAEKGGLRNHYDAFVKLEDLLVDYEKEENRELMAIIVTDGFADKGSPNEFYEYNYLKDQYPFLAIKGIQFDSAEKTLPYMTKISDEQYVASLTDLESVLNRSAELPVSYDEFVLRDWIDPNYFSVESVSSIKASSGKVDLVEEEGNQKIIWNLGSFETGEKHELTIDLNLNSEFHDGNGIYPTNIKEEVSYKLENIEETVTSNETPSLSSHYSVIYDVNEPTGCTVESPPVIESHRPLETVKINDEAISCPDYQFLGWKIVTTGLENNEKYFQMPESNVVLEAEWAKLTIVKSMDGDLNPKLAGVLMEHGNTGFAKYNEKIWKYRKDVTKIVFEDYIHSHHSEVEVFDISRFNNGSVLGRVVSNEDGETYTIYIQADGMIISQDYSCIGLFSGFSKLENIEGLEHFDTREAIDMTEMFDGCSSLKELDLSHFRTSVDHDPNTTNYYPGVIHMGAMFRNCSSLKTLDLRSFDTKRLVTADCMFQGCTSLESIDLSSFNIENLNVANSMFQDCTSLKELDLSSFNKTIPNLQVANQMFMNCHNLEKIDLGHMNPMGNLSGMFAGCYKLKELDLSNFTFTFAISNMSSMFSECYSLTSLDLSNFNTRSVETMRSMFAYCTNLTEIKINPDTFTTAKVTDMALMFVDCESLLSIDVSKFDTSQVIDMNQMFSLCGKLSVIDVSGFDTTNVRDMSFMFDHCSAVTSLEVGGFKTSNVLSMANMFADCSSLSTLDVSNFDTSKVTDMSVMFRRCSSLPVLDVSHFDTTQVVDMNNMFDGCSSLTALDVSNFNTSNVRGMAAMFASLNQVPFLDVSKFDTSKVENMTYMFAYCFALNNLDTSHFDTSKVTDMSYMFDSCYAISNIDLSVADTSHARDMNHMFNECYMLEEIKGTIDTSSARDVSGMFTYDYFLKATVNINCDTDVGFNQIFFEVATEPVGLVTVNYTNATSDLVDQMIATKSANGNIVKGALIS